MVRQSFHIYAPTSLSQNRRDILSEGLGKLFFQLKRKHSQIPPVKPLRLAGAVSTGCSVNDHMLQLSISTRSLEGPLLTDRTAMCECTPQRGCKEHASASCILLTRNENSAYRFCYSRCGRLLRHAEKETGDALSEQEQIAT